MVCTIIFLNNLKLIWGGLFLLKFEAALFQNVISRDQKYRFGVNLIELGSVV